MIFGRFAILLLICFLARDYSPLRADSLLFPVSNHLPTDQSPSDNPELPVPFEWDECEDGPGEYDFFRLDNLSLCFELSIGFDTTSIDNSLALSCFSIAVLNTLQQLRI